MRFLTLGMTLVLLVALLAAMPAPVQPAGPALHSSLDGPTTLAVSFSREQVSDDAVIDTAPTLALDSQGKVHIAYDHFDGSTIDVYYATNASGSWVNTPRTNSAQDRIDPSIAVDSNNKVHIAYQADSVNDTEIYYDTNASGSWTSTPVTSDSDDDVWPSIAVDGAGKAHIVYRGHPGSDEIYYATNASGSWVSTLLTDPSAYTGDESPSIALDSAGKAHVSYVAWDDPTGKIYYATNASGSWVSTLAASFTGSSVLGLTTSIAVDGSGKVHIAYTVSESSNDLEIYYATNASGSWTSVRVTDNTTKDGNPSIAVDGAGKAHIVYKGWDGDDEVYYANNTSGSWNIWRVTDNTTDDGVGSSAWSAVDRALVLDSAGYAHIVYDGFDGHDYEIYYAKSTHPVTGGSGSGTCANPLTIACNQTVSGDTTGKANLHSGYCSAPWDESGPENIYRFTLAAGNNYTVTASLSNVAPNVDLDVFLLSDCNAGTCLELGSFGDVGAVATNVPPGTYYIAVDGYAGEAGSYDLKLECLHPGGGNPPHEPSHPQPADGATGVPLNTPLRWQGGDPDGDTVHYTLRGGETWLGFYTTWYTGTQTSFRPSVPLADNTQYSWYVEAQDTRGNKVTGPTWYFTTGTKLLSPKAYLPLLLRKR